MDYLIADGTVVPRAQQRHYAEKIAYLPGAFLPFDSSYAIADRTSHARSSDCRPMDSCFAASTTAIKSCLRLFNRWMRIRAGPKTVCVAAANRIATAAGNLRKQASRRGIDGAPPIFADRMASLPEHFSRLRVADLFLDTFPYNAHSTALDALWAGLPLLTCRARASLAAWRRAFAYDRPPDLVAGSPLEYEDKAVDLAADPMQLGHLRRKLAVRGTPLFDTERYTRNLEAVYEATNERHHSGSPPADINDDLAI